MFDLRYSDCNRHLGRHIGRISLKDVALIIQKRLTNVNCPPPKTGPLPMTIDVIRKKVGFSNWNTFQSNFSSSSVRSVTLCFCLLESFELS